MRSAHTERTAPLSGPARPHRRDGGYVLAMSALILLPLLAFTGLAVDLGSWYSRASAVQRATDAASLAGVAALPGGFGGAEAAAFDVAARNGFVNGSDNVTVSVDQNNLPPDQLRVTIRVDDVPQYFTSIFGNEVAIERTSVAEYVPAVKMGSPRNFLGTGPMMSSPENFWLAISGPCSSKEQGERIQTLSDANFSSSSNPRPYSGSGSGASFSGCAAGDGGHVVANTEYRPSGYFYGVYLEEDYEGELHIDVFDGGYCQGSGPASNTIDGVTVTGNYFDTTFTVRSNDSGNPGDATVVSQRTLEGGVHGTGDCRRTDQTGPQGWATYPRTTYLDNLPTGWRPLHTFNNPTRGTYYIQVQTSADHTNLTGSNAFALRARRGATFQPCSSDQTDGAYAYDSTCPNVFALEHLGVVANIGGDSGSQATFYLADIGHEHSGKTMIVEMWDAGEGAQALEILGPNLEPIDFTWRVACPSGDTPPTGGCGPATTNILDLVGATDSEGREWNPQPGGHRLSRSKYNDRLIIIEIPLPDLQAIYGQATWWRVRYTVGSAPTDRTTWSVTVRGDPVRLIE
jgi:hypothetical protein